MSTTETESGQANANKLGSNQCDGAMRLCYCIAHVQELPMSHGQRACISTCLQIAETRS